MKFFITESQNRKIKDLIINRFRKGDNLLIINKLMGLPFETIVDMLMDEEIKHDEHNKCEKYNQAIYGVLALGRKIKSEYKYDDGSIIELRYDEDDDVMTFKFYSNKKIYIYGRATIFYDRDCVLQIQPDAFQDDGDFKRIFRKFFINIKNAIEGVNTYRQLAHFYNNEYFYNLKENLDKVTNEINKGNF